jgi:hypothetical protein
MGRLSAHVSTRKHTRGKKKREWMLEKEKRRESEYLLSGIYHQQACYRNTERCCLAIISREIEAVLRITAPVAPEALFFWFAPIYLLYKVQILTQHPLWDSHFLSPVVNLRRCTTSSLFARFTCFTSAKVSILTLLPAIYVWGLLVNMPLSIYT